MFHKAVELRIGKGTELEVVFQDGTIKRYDMSQLFGKYPQLLALKDRSLFTSAHLCGSYGIVWNDELDVEVETIYQDGVTVGRTRPAENLQIGESVASARAKKGLSQKDLSKATGIDQADISRIERGLANPSVNTLRRIADALGAKLKVSIF